MKSSFIKREKTVRKRLTLLALALALCLNQIACGAGKSTVSNTPPAQMNGIDDAWTKVFEKKARYRYVMDMKA